MKLRRTQEATRVALCGERALSIGGMELVPDATRAYVDFYLAHGFPVVTSDKTALHPAVVRNSYRSLMHKVFNLAHLMRAYDPENNPRDRILGTVVAVELYNDGGSGVSADKGASVGIHAAAVIHKQAEQAPRILSSHFTGEMNWTVSMEHNFTIEDCGLLVRGRRGVESFEASTPKDLADLGYVYVPMPEAPGDLLECYDDAESRIAKDFRGQETVVLFGGLNGQVHFKGVGLTPLGKEPEARVGQMLASGAATVDRMVEVLRRGTKISEE